MGWLNAVPQRKIDIKRSEQQNKMKSIFSKITEPTSAANPNPDSSEEEQPSSQQPVNESEDHKAADNSGSTESIGLSDEGEGEEEE